MTTTFQIERVIRPDLFTSLRSKLMDRSASYLLMISSVAWYLPDRWLERAEILWGPTPKCEKTGRLHFTRAEHGGDVADCCAAPWRCSRHSYSGKQKFIFIKLTQPRATQTSPEPTADLGSRRSDPRKQLSDFLTTRMNKAKDISVCTASLSSMLQCVYIPHHERRADALHRRDYLLCHTSALEECRLSRASPAVT